jgi:hypothetical protein
MYQAKSMAQFMHDLFAKAVDQYLLILEYTITFVSEPVDGGNSGFAIQVGLTEYIG